MSIKIRLFIAASLPVLLSLIFVVAESHQALIIGLSGLLFTGLGIALLLPLFKVNAAWEQRLHTGILANISHEIRTPLSVIIGMSKLFDKARLSEDQLEKINAIQTSADILMNHLNDILDMSRLEADEFILEEYPFSIHELFNSLEVMFKPLLSMSNIRFLIGKIPDDIPAELLGDGRHLQQMLVNLINNAVKFTPTGSIKVLVVVTAQDHSSIRLRFSVMDTGIGIPAEQLKSIFEKFKQVDGYFMHKTPGTGLGLAIVKQVAQRMGGDAGCESELRRGSLFWIEVPLKFTSVPFAGQVLQSVPEAIDLTGLHIAVVDDNDMVLTICQQILGAEGAKVSTYENGKIFIEAVKNARNNDFDLIFMDLQMPVMGGLEATRLLKNVHQVATPVIALTAGSLRSEREAAFREGMTGFMTKPIEAGALIRIVKDEVYQVASRRLQRVTQSIKEPAVPVVEHVVSTQDFVYIDSATALANLRGNRQLYHSIVQSFLSRIEKIQAEFIDEIIRQDIAALRKTAHFLRGAYEQLGGKALVNEMTPLVEQLKAGVDRHQAEQISQRISDLIQAGNLELTSISAALSREI